MRRAELKIAGGQAGVSRLGYVLFLILAAGVGLEVALRSLDPIGIQYLYEVRKYFRTMLVSDERYAYIHKADYTDTLQGVPISFNSHGLRWPEFELDKPEEKSRLVILGDSVVLGWGLEQEAIFPARIQALFDELGAPVEIIAAGVGSWNTRTEYEYLRHVAVNFQPDVLLLLIVSNDTDPKRDSGYTEVPKSELFPNKKQDRGALANGFEDFWRFSARRSYLAAYIKYLWQQKMPSGSSGQPMDGNSPQWRDAQLALDGIIALCQERGIDLIVYLYGSDRAIQGDAILALYDGHLKSRGISALTFPDELLTDPGYRNSMVDSHLNNAGNEIMTDVMFKELRQRLVRGLSKTEATATSP